MITNLILNVCAVVSNVVIATTPMQLVPVYATRKSFDDPECFPCHRPYLLVLADCSCKYEEYISHYVVVPMPPKEAEKLKEKPAK